MLTPFHLVCMRGHAKLAALFVQNSSEFNIDLNAKRNANGFTGFHFACHIGHLDTIELLIDNAEEFNIDLTAQCNKGMTGLEHAELMKGMQFGQWMEKRDNQVYKNVYHKYINVVNLIKEKMSNFEEK